jgi:2-methylisocitrate lyase-like PEP mutase family enzyme
VFADAGDYLASRDLSGFVGLSEKMPKVSDLMALKTNIRERIADVVEAVELPEEVDVAEGWSDYAARVVSTLKGAA